jgi:hypothetical protein
VAPGNHVNATRVIRHGTALPDRERRPSGQPDRCRVAPSQPPSPHAVSVASKLRSRTAQDHAFHRSKSGLAVAQAGRGMLPGLTARRSSPHWSWGGQDGPLGPCGEVGSVMQRKVLSRRATWPVRSRWGAGRGPDLMPRSCRRGWTSATRSRVGPEACSDRSRGVGTTLLLSFTRPAGDSTGGAPDVRLATRASRWLGERVSVELRAYPVDHVSLAVSRRVRISRLAAPLGAARTPPSSVSQRGFGQRRYAARCNDLPYHCLLPFTPSGVGWLTLNSERRVS